MAEEENKESNILSIEEIKQMLIDGHYETYLKAKFGYEFDSLDDTKKEKKELALWYLTKHLTKKQDPTNECKNVFGFEDDDGIDAVLYCANETFLICSRLTDKDIDESIIEDLRLVWYKVKGLNFNRRVKEQLEKIGAGGAFLSTLYTKINLVLLTPAELSDKANEEFEKLKEEMKQANQCGADLFLSGTDVFKK